MKNLQTKLLLIIFSLFISGSALAADTVDTEIQYLISYVGESGCSFERNGSVYDSAKAEDHLNLKYRRGKRYATSAENFIRRLASKSSFSGKPYFIICEDTGRQKAQTWLMNVLSEYRQQYQPGLAP